MHGNSPTVIIPTFENVYEKYGSMLYGIATEISATEEQAEQILVSTFQKVFTQNLYKQEDACLCATLIKLLIQSAHEQLNGTLKNNLKLKQFEKTPLLHKLLCESITMEDYCRDNKLSKAEIAKNIRQEFNSFR